MAQRKKNAKKQVHVVVGQMQPKRAVQSLLDVMVDGKEYASLVDVLPASLNLGEEIRRAIDDVEAITQRPLLLYAANTIRPVADPAIPIVPGDDLPFSEMVNTVPAAAPDVDIMLVTPGGVAQQVSLFVDRLRQRFQRINYIIPQMCMSAGTIWALSGDEIWMDERAAIGPIDPQVPNRDGRFVPAQALLVLLKDIQDKGAQEIAAGRQPEWTHVQLLRNIDPREIGNTISQSQYSIQLAANYLANFKFKSWSKHSDGSAVTDPDRQAAAKKAAEKLCAHEQWKTHGHGISREVAWRELRLKIEHPETVQGLQRSIRRLWALLYWTFENTSILKCFVSKHYTLFRATQQKSPP